MERLNDKKLIPIFECLDMLDEEKSFSTGLDGDHETPIAIDRKKETIEKADSNFTTPNDLSTSPTVPGTPTARATN